MNSIEKSKCEKTGQLIVDLVNREPNLPIYAMVDTEVVAGDDYSGWLGSFRRAEIDSLYNGREKTWLLSELTYNTTRLAEFFEAEAPLKYLEKVTNLNDDEAIAIMWMWMELRNWKKCILLYIGTPDSL